MNVIEYSYRNIARFIYLDLVFSQPLKHAKTILSLGALHKRAAGQTGPRALSPSVLISGFSSVAPGQAAAASPRNLSEMGPLRPTPHLLRQKLGAALVVIQIHGQA